MKGSIELMKNVIWQYTKAPHGLICGETGSGKTFLIEALILGFLKEGANIRICDPKMSDLVFLGAVPSLSDKVFYTENKMLQCMREFHEDMKVRQEEFMRLSFGTTGNTFADFDMKPEVLVFDEYVAFVSTLEMKEQRAFFGHMNQIILLGRQLGFFLIAGMQRPDAQFLPNGMRDQFGFRCAMGSMSPNAYIMMFGEANKAFRDYGKEQKGWGYANLGTGTIQTFFAPYVAKEFNFVTEIAKFFGEEVLTSLPGG
ncbi:FtsK/SpoIIIE domain-containing protein [Carnobacterium maltaromaticum]|uniref:FtsK/SpoIIIE domain-containing protein n=1 Tax=Carnobacterium maltaromaticum TaxID=2751 RepID=UPI0039BE85CE